ncbi:MAG: ribonuclease III [Phycisphaeraceae bacterium]|nr:ribonuclease III [Phycisphaeraceae bacterium]MCW5755382.1 ribonuclease III [Phycisphaeraceae bacterium]
MDQSLRTSVEQAIGYRFTDENLLEVALRHASIAEVRSQSNERMEFLGDAVLGMVVCEMIYKRFPDLLEGEMTKIKSAVVSRRVCAEIARELGLDEQLTLGKGMQGHHQLPQSLAAAVLEAIIAAIYLDGGYAAATNFIRGQLRDRIEQAYLSGHQQNFKSLLQQHAQQMMSPPPIYRVLDEKGPDHAKCFKVAVEVLDRRFESAWGPNKKQAEQQAALNALVALGIITESDAGEPVLSPNATAD